MSRCSESTRLRRTSEGSGLLEKHRAPGGAEHVGEDPGELREVRVEQARALHLDLGELRLERLVVAREGPQGLHVVGREPRGVVLAYAHRLGDEAGVDAVVLDAAQALEPAHRAHLQRVYDRHRVPPGREERVQRHPVVPGGLHAHEDVRGGRGHALQPRLAPLESRRAVLEAHGPTDPGAALVDGPYDVVHLGDVHTGVDHLSALPSDAGRTGRLPRSPGTATS